MSPLPNPFEKERLAGDQVCAVESPVDGQRLAQLAGA